MSKETSVGTTRGFRIKQAADYIGSTPWFVEVNIRSGALRAMKLGRHYVLLKEDLDRFLDKAAAATKAIGE